ncbi:MAG: class I SAM-dependent methyltransferase [Microthrixaceae bacterium]
MSARADSSEPGQPVDAAGPLIDIARARTPDADLRVGDMFSLPWPDESFDAVTSINGIWGGCEQALAEAHRVLRPGGSIAISRVADLRPCFKAFAANSPASHVDGMRRTNAIARPGVAENMLGAVGFEVLERDSCGQPSNGRTRRQPGGRWPASVLAVLASKVRRRRCTPPQRRVHATLRDDNGIYRFRNDQQFVVARKG